MSIMFYDCIDNLTVAIKAFYGYLVVIFNTPVRGIRSVVEEWRGWWQGWC
ncbi:hypothetical protein [Muribaculum intestinale]